MIFPKLHIKHSLSIFFLILCGIVLILLIADYYYADTGRSRYFKSCNFPYGVKPISLNDKVKLFVDSSDIILAGNFLESKRFYNSKAEHRIEYILEYAHNQDSLIVKYLDYDNNIRYMILEKKENRVAFQEIYNGYSIFEKTKLKKDSFKYTAYDSSFYIITLLHLVIHLTISIYLVLFMIKYRRRVYYLIIYCMVLIGLYLYIDYKGGLKGANISTYHIVHPKSVIELDFKETPASSSHELNSTKKTNIFFNTTSFLDSNYIFSFFFLTNGVIAQYYDNNTRNVKYAHLQSSPSINEKIDGDFEMLTEDFIISLFIGKWYDIDVKPIETYEVYEKLTNRYKTLWINIQDIYSAWIFRNLIKFGLKLLFLISLYYIIKNIHQNIHNRKIKCS